MNLTKFIPENTVSIFVLAQDRPISGKLAIGFDKLVRWNMKIFRDDPDFILSDERATVSFTTVSTLSALKYRLHGITCRGVDPWPF
jgi:hypothetical protein